MDPHTFDSAAAVSFAATTTGGKKGEGGKGKGNSGGSGGGGGKGEGKDDKGKPTQFTARVEVRV